MNRMSNLESVLFSNKKKNFLKYNNKENYFESEDKDKYIINEGIPNLFDDEENEISKIQSSFYNEVKFPNYDDIDDFGSLLDKSSRSTFFRKLDEEIPMFSKILEAGCGTGQLSLFLSRFKRQIYSIDLSSGSLSLGEKFRKKNNIENLFFLKMSIFNMFFQKNFFDVIISNGVLHHTKNAEEAFYELTKYLKKDGYIVIGLYHKYGRFFTKVKQFLIKYFSDFFKFLDPKTYSNKYSENKNFAWFMDQYKNPKETTHTFIEVKSWFNKSNIEFVSSIPFSFPGYTLVSEQIFKKKEIDPNFKIIIKEMTQAFSHQQIKEGGFFIMIGKKK